MKRFGYILTLFGGLALTLCVFSGCIASKKKEKSSSSLTEKTFEHELSYEIATVDSAQSILKEVVTVTHFDDELKGSMHLVPFEKDSIESGGVKVVAQLIPQSTGGYKVRIHGKAKAVSKTEKTTEANQSYVSVEESLNKAIEKQREKEESSKVKLIKKKACPFGGYGSLYSLSSLSEFTNFTAALTPQDYDQTRTTKQGKSLALRRNVDSFNGVAKNVWTANGQSTSREVFRSGHRSPIETGYSKLRGTGRMCATYPVARRLSRSYRKNYYKFIQPKHCQATLFATNGIPSSPYEYARKENSRGHRYSERSRDKGKREDLTDASRQTRIKNTCGLEKVLKARTNIYPFGCCPDVLCSRHGVA